MTRSAHIHKSFFGDVPSASEPSRQRNSSAHLRNSLKMCHSFTDSEERETGTPSPAHWQRQDDYEHVSIGELAPGSRKVFFLARVVNLYDQPTTHSKVQESAKGCLKLLVKDDSALISVCSMSPLSFIVSTVAEHRKTDQPMVYGRGVSIPPGGSTVHPDNTPFVKLSHDNINGEQSANNALHQPLSRKRRRLQHRSG